MNIRIIYCLLFTAIGFQSCFYRSQEYVNIPCKDDPDYIEAVDSNGYVSTGIFNHDKELGFNSDVFGAYRLARLKEKIIKYDLLKMEEPTMRIFDTLSFHFDFLHPDSSYYYYYDSEYRASLKKREVSVTYVPLAYKGKLSSIKDCGGCSIYKYESSYKGKCYDWFVSDSIGFLKTYGPYSDLGSNINDYEIRFMVCTPKYYYAKKLLESIKANKEFHTRCSPGTLW